MSTWEYHVVRGGSLEALARDLNALGQAEWEVVGVVGHSVHGATTRVEAVLKRAVLSGASARRRGIRDGLARAGMAPAADGDTDR